MYLQEILEGIFTTTLVKIKYDCHGEERLMKYCDAKKNFEKNKGKHICRPCWLKSDDNPFKKEDIKQKIKNTIDEKYNGVHPANSPENIEKRRQQFKDEEFLKQWNEKHKITSQKTYGTDHPMQSKIVQDKQKEGMQKKHGVDYPYQSPEIMANMKANNLIKHGVENVAQMPETQEKMKKTMEERYGIKYYNQLPEMKDYLRENCKDWLKESWANPWAKGITRPEEWNEKQSKTMTDLYVSGDIQIPFGSYKQGHYISKKCVKSKLPYFRSSLELIVHCFLDDQEKVEWYDYEPFGIIYNINGKTRRFIPDFFIKYYDVSKPIIIEIKPQFRMREIITEFKVEAGKKFAELNEMLFEYWDEKFINSLGYNVEELMKSDKVQK